MYMKKVIVCLLLIAMFTSVLTGCCLSHEWTEATCTAPSTCTKCGETEGTLLPHNWEEATCSVPKKCLNCGATEGETLPHIWVEATCKTAKVCAVCAAVEGNPLPHTWIEATCVTPETCSVCGYVNGVAPGHTPKDWVENPNNSKEQISVCVDCDEIIDTREYLVEFADGMTWSWGDIPDVIYRQTGFLVSCNEFMRVYARALTHMTDHDEYATQLNFFYDSYHDIKIMRDQTRKSFVALSFEGNDNLDAPMRKVTLVVEADKLLSNYTSYKSVLLEIFGALPLAIDESMLNIQEGTELIVELINKVVDDDISCGTVSPLSSYISHTITKNGVKYTVQIDGYNLKISASI